MSMKLEKFHKIITETPQETKDEIRFQLEILERISELLEEKFEGKQKLLADKLGKSEAEVSKWLNGVQNFTLKTIFNLERAFGEQIITISKKNNTSTFIQDKQILKKKKVENYK